MRHMTGVFVVSGVPAHLADRGTRPVIGSFSRCVSPVPLSLVSKSVWHARILTCRGGHLDGTGILRVPIIHPAWSGGMSVLVQGSA